MTEATSIPFDPANHIENLMAENDLGYSLWALSNKNLEGAIVELPSLTRDEMLMLVLILQNEAGEEWVNEEVAKVVFDLYTRIRSKWRYVE